LTKWQLNFGRAFAYHEGSGGSLDRDGNHDKHLYKHVDLTVSCQVLCIVCQIAKNPSQMRPLTVELAHFHRISLQMIDDVPVCGSRSES
jgi:hypothetical protein